MASMRSGPALYPVLSLFDGRSVSGLSEAELLDRFASRRDEAAFAALVALHGPMVLATCRGVLRDPTDAEDAFQPTFLVLVKKAGALQVVDFTLASPFDSAHRLKAWFDLAPEKRAEIERLPSTIWCTQSLNTRGWSE